MKTWVALICRERFKGKRQSENVAVAAKQRGVKHRKKRFKTHKIVEVPVVNEKSKHFRLASQFWCVSCLTKIAGYGGGSRARLEGLTCFQSKRPPQAKARINRAWATIKKYEDVNGDPLYAQLSQWVRNLLEDGDIESNPGPSGIRMQAYSL